MNFSTVIADNYSTRQQRALKALLHKAGIYSTLESSTNLFYHQWVENSDEDRLLLFEAMVNHTLTTVTLWYRQENRGEQRTREAGTLTHFGFILVEMALKHTGKKAKIYLSLITNLLQKEPLQLEWAYFVVHLLEGKLQHHQPAVAKSKSKNRKARSLNPYLHLKWLLQKTDRKNKVTRSAFFKEICKVLPGVGPARNLEMLFRHGFNNYKITVPEEHLRAYLALFRLLRNAKRIKCCDNKGLFHLLQAHTEVIPYKKLKLGRDFRKIDYETRNNPALESDVQAQLAPLLACYLPPKEDPASPKPQK